MDQTKTNIQHYDVIIVGGGPAGATCALQLRHSDLRVLLIDKATFPRVKICGDAVVGRSIKTLRKCCPEMSDMLDTLTPKARITKTRMSILQHKPFEINWVNEAYCCTRYDFDNMLIQAVKQFAPNVTILENFSVDSVGNTEGGIVIGNIKSNQYFKTPIIVGCDGAQSVVAKKLTDTKLSHHDHAAAVRTYFKNVKGLDYNTTEVYLLKGYLPGYLWIFPISEGYANVGFGMLSEAVSAQKFNLREALLDCIHNTPTLRPRFENSEQVGKTEGFGLPLGSRRVQMSGNHFLLTGDAASLIDPTSGDGISNAIVSGKVAGETIIEAYKNKNFSADFLKNYDKNLFKIIGEELQKSTFGLRILMKMPFLHHVGAVLMGNSVINRFAKRFM
jgi:menaquinone-9 beta-reductase